MNFKTWLKHYRKRRKIQRVKPHFWHLPAADGGQGLGYIQNYKAGTRSIRQAAALYLMKQLPENEGREITYDEVTEDVVERFDKLNSGFYLPNTIRQKWPDLPIFTFVRNPLSRLYSCYANKVLDAGKSGGKLPFEALGVTADMSFDEFVQIVATIPDERAERHFRSQAWFLSADGKLITDYIGKIERFNEDWEELREKFGMPPSPHNNRSSMGKADFSTFYSKESYRLATERYRGDIELFGYQNDV
ncbi:hypothetical protein NT6N_35000 [Oceaniferula spumae]|uniref:Sulfotransferase family protein n=1 Tax=Oceaniferula spumae TaxID=2979115 RepID=A0AAT9FR25_9BACT